MGEQLGRPLSRGVGADLTFEVAGETFAAHIYILAVRSPLEEIMSGCLMKRTEAASCGIVQISDVEECSRPCSTTSTPTRCRR
jgi:speckle-type POZ protein